MAFGDTLLCGFLTVTLASLQPGGWRFDHARLHFPCLLDGPWTGLGFSRILRRWAEPGQRWSVGKPAQAAVEGHQGCSKQFTGGGAVEDGPEHGRGNGRLVGIK